MLSDVFWPLRLMGCLLHKLHNRCGPLKGALICSQSTVFLCFFLMNMYQTRNLGSKKADLEICISLYAYTNELSSSG